MDRLYYKIVDVAMDLAMNANRLAMNANNSDDIDQAIRPLLPHILNVVDNARDIINLALIRQKITNPDSVIL